MKCPNCNGELVVPNHARHNVSTYQKSAMTATGCCQSFVRLIPYSSFRVEAYEGNATEDDWGYQKNGLFK